MNLHSLVKAGAGRKAEQTASKPILTNKDQGNQGLASIKKGQHITGRVISVEEQVTLDFSGQRILADRNVFGSVAPGETKTFEVVKASGQEIELRLLFDSIGRGKKTFKANLEQESGWDTLLKQRKKAVEKADKEAELKERKSKLEEIHRKLTGQDIQLLEEEGFQAEELTVDGLCEALNRVKTWVKEEGQSRGAASGKDIAERLKNENLPVTPENLTKVANALELSVAAGKMDDKTMRDLISREAQPTIENIYKAYYSGSERKPETISITEEQWSVLEPQAKEVISAAGFEADNANLADARWLLENNLPLTAETFTYKKALEDIKADMNPEQVLDKIMEGMQSGTSPKDASLMTRGRAPIEQILTDTQSISDEAVEAAVREGAELTIRRLVTIEEELSARGNRKASEAVIAESDISEEVMDEPVNEDIAVDSNENTRHYEEVRAKRQLEEIRLRMSYEVAMRLERKGFSIETQRLEEVVKALKELEESYYRSLYVETGEEASEASLQLLKETTQSVENLRTLPSYVLGSSLRERSTQTIQGLLTEGRQLQSKLEKAGEAYETLMTVPNREYGDSIKKAFANIDNLLSNIDMEPSKQNVRAARILGYNHMEINEENVNHVKAYDLQVTSLIKNLNPAVTVRLIKDGINPMEMTIRELNSKIDQLKEDQGLNAEDQYASYLRRLEKDKGITPEERKAYIGMYRLLYNVEKSDGAALGAVIKSGREVTLGSLLTAIQTAKKGQLDAVINEEFGTLQSITRDKESISSQLSALGQENEQQGGKQFGYEEREAFAEEQIALEEQTEYLDRILKQLKEEMSPERLQAAVENNEGMATYQANQPQRATGIPESETGLWDLVKDIPVEKLLEELIDMEEGQNTEDEVYDQKAREIRELCKNSEQALRFLNDFKMPSTPLHIMIAHHILSNEESVIKKFQKLRSENKVENEENNLKENEDLADKLVDKVTMEGAYKNLEADAKEALTQVCSQEIIDSARLTELKSMGQQMTFLRRLAEKEFYQLPIETESGITNINLTIIRGSQKTGSLLVTLESKELGSIKADFTLKNRTLKGFISSDSRYGLEQLKKNTGAITEAAASEDVLLKQMDYCLVQRGSEVHSYRPMDAPEQDAPADKESEGILYRLAKAFVQTVRISENIK